MIKIVYYFTSLFICFICDGNLLLLREVYLTVLGDVTPKDFELTLCSRDSISLLSNQGSNELRAKINKNTCEEEPSDKKNKGQFFFTNFSYYCQVRVYITEY